MITLVLGLLGAWWCVAERQQALAAEASRLETLVATAEANVARLLRGTLAGLQAVRQEAGNWPPAEREAFIERRLAAVRGTMAGVLVMQWRLADGSLLADSLPGRGAGGPPGAAFELARDHPDPTRLWVSAPHAAGSGLWQLDVALPIVDADGRFAGALITSLERAYFDDLLASVLYAPDMRASVLHGGGRIAAAAPVGGRLEGEVVLGPGTPFGRHLATGGAASLQRALSPTRHTDVLVAFRTLRSDGLGMEPPLVLTASRTVEAILRPWRVQTGWFAAVFVVTAAAALMALLAVQRRRSAEAADAERLRLALRGGDLALWDLDLVADHSVVNERWSTMLGYRPGEIDATDAGWQALLHPDDRDRVLALQTAHLAGRTEAFEATYRIRHRDGRYLWILDRGRVLARAPDGRPLRMVGTHMDVTTEMEAEATLRRSEQNLAVTLQSIGDGVIATEATGIVTRINDAARRLTGWPGDSAIGRPLAEVFDIRNAQTGQRHLDPVARVLAGAGVVALENGTVLRARDGREAQIADSAAPIRAPGGEIQGVVLVFSDVTEQYRTLQALRQSERKSRGLLEALQSGVIVHAPDLRILDANPAACRILGLTREQIVGRPVTAETWPALGEDGRPLAFAQMPVARVLAEDQPVVDIVVGLQRPPPLEAVWVLCSAFPLRDDAGVLQELVVTFSDFTARKRAEEQRAELERQVREAQRIESLGTLAGGIAHDFNNILAAILGNASLARDTLPAAHPAMASLDRIHKAGLRARSLVQQILTFSRRDPAALHPQPLKPVVEETVNLLRATLPATVRLEVRVAETPLVAEADATQLQQVLMNLCTNAWHALPDARGRIEIGLAEAHGDPALPPSDPRARRHAHLWVADDGTGMDADTRARLFDPFFTTKPVGQGTGLGLSVAHGIVLGHGGVIDVDTEPGLGSTFHVRLPLSERPAEEPSVPAPAAAGPGAGRHALVLDDDEVMAVTAQALLERAGWRVTRCASAAEALALLADPAQTVHVVVSDQNMPEMSGTEFAVRLRAVRPGLPLVISSGFLSDELRQAAVAAGVSALLHKEHTLERLAALAHEVAQGAPEGGS